MSGGTSQPVYVPVLRGRMGELRALAEMSSGTADAILPVIEALPTYEQTDDGEPEWSSLRNAVRKFAADLGSRWSQERRMIVDASQLPTNDEWFGSSEMIDALMESGHNFTPVVRPSDAPASIQAVRERIHDWGLRAACIRLSGEDLDDADQPLSDSLDQVLNDLDLGYEEVDLLLDFGYLADDTAASFAARIARLVLGELPAIAEWRTLTCAGGAFPGNLSNVQPEVFTELPRWDEQMWGLVRDRARDRVPLFGDFGVANPAAASGVAFAPAPQLRFTWEQNWQVMKGRRRDRRGSRQFFDICERFVGNGWVEPALSWGDRYVHLAAESAGGDEQVGPGNAMIWRAIGTSHHIAYVVSRLANDLDV